MERIPYWNIPYGFLIDLLAVPVIAIFFYGMYRQMKTVSKEDPINWRKFWKFTRKRLNNIQWQAFIRRAILGIPIYRKEFSGIAHGFIYWGMVILFAGTILVLFNVLFGLPVFKGIFNRWFMSGFLDIAGMAVFLGCIFFLVRRLFPPERIVFAKSRSGFVPAGILLLTVIFTGFLLEGFRIATAGGGTGAVIGILVASGLHGGEGNLVFHRLLWWMHGLISLTFIAYTPFSPLIHILLAPLNIAFTDHHRGIRARAIDFKALEALEADTIPTLGAEKLKDFNRTQLLEFATCLWCGRCHEVCPAAETQKPLSPKGVIVTLAEYLQKKRFQESFIADSVGMEAIYACTTCGACMQACPVSIQPPRTILEIRQNLLMEQSRIPELMGKANHSLESRQHPFFGTGSSRRDWQKGMDVPVYRSGETEYLLWIGCAATYEERAQKIAISMVKILQRAGVSFGIQKDCRCTGDPAKQMGNEFLFYEIARQNIEEFSVMRVDKIITLCPHCYQSLCFDYRRLGGHYQVVPHSRMILHLIEGGKLQLKKTDQTICFHDPCYLGRHNGVFQEPRSLLSTIADLREMGRSREESFCCGGGGGNYWAEEQGKRINQTRAKEALTTGAGKIATACPFCLLMLTDGVKKFTEEQVVYDIAEIVDSASL